MRIFTLVSSYHCLPQEAMFAAALATSTETGEANELNLLDDAEGEEEEINEEDPNDD